MLKEVRNYSYEHIIIIILVILFSSKIKSPVQLLETVEVT